MIPHRYAIEEKVFQRPRRGPIKKYRWVIYRVSRNYDGTPVYLRTIASTAWVASRGWVCRTAWDQLGVEKNRYPWHIDDDKYRLEDASDGKPVTERDVLKFLPEFTHPMAALDKLRDLLEDER